MQEGLGVKSDLHWYDSLEQQDINHDILGQTLVALAVGVKWKYALFS